jgi:TPR repeat protein
MEYFERLFLMAKAGDYFSMHDLAVHLESGRNLLQNYDAAFFWYRLAAEKGFAGSQNNLGDLYERGKGVEESFGDAVYWYTQAAMQGEPVAYFSLGTCFLKGIGVRQDYKQAAFWLTLATEKLPAGLNHKDAKSQLGEAISHLEQAEIAQAFAKANMFRPLRQTDMIMSDRSENESGLAPDEIECH